MKQAPAKTQVRMDRDLKTEPEFTPEEENRILAAAEEAKDPANLSNP